MLGKMVAGGKLISLLVVMASMTLLEVMVTGGKVINHLMVIVIMAIMESMVIGGSKLNISARMVVSGGKRICLYNDLQLPYSKPNPGAVSPSVVDGDGQSADEMMTMMLIPLWSLVSEESVLSWGMFLRGWSL